MKLRVEEVKQTLASTRLLSSDLCQGSLGDISSVEGSSGSQRNVTSFSQCILG